MFGATLLASLVVITQIWSRLVHHHVGDPAAVPTLWIVLGPLGQSVTAAHALGATAGASLPEPYATGYVVMAVVYGVPVWGFALLWASLATSITVATLRRGLPFSLSWWSFTFPVGTVVTGTSGLAVATGSMLFTWVACALFVVLVLAWVVVATRTVRRLDQLLLPPLTTG
jgi:tellurite resistance protein TehA-like permease